MPSEVDPATRDAQREILAGAPPMAPMPPDEGPGIVTNSAYNIVGRVLGGGASALSGLVTLRVLGPAAAGALAVVFGLVELGRGLSNFTHNPSIMEVHRGKDPTRVFGTSLALKLVGSVVMVLAVAALGPMLATTFAVPYLAATFDIPYAALLLASLVLMAGIFFEVGAARLESENRMAVSNLILASGPAVGLLAILVLWWLGALNIYTSIAATLLANVTMSVGFVFAWKGPLRFRFDKAEASFLIHYGSRLVLSTFLTSALLWTDTLMLSLLRGNYETGIYQAAFNLTFIMVGLAVSIGVALVPAIARLAGSGSSTEAAYQRATMLALLLSVGMAIAYVLFGKFFLGLASPEYVQGYPALLVLTVFGIAGALAVPAASMLTVHGHANWLTALSAGQLIANVLLNFFLIREWGILGAATATTIAFSVGTVTSWLLVRQTIGAWPISREVFRELRLGVLRRR